MRIIVMLGFKLMGAFFSKNLLGVNVDHLVFCLESGQQLRINTAVARKEIARTAQNAQGEDLAAAVEFLS